MTDGIIKLRERLVELSTDPIETRKLLDQLTEEEIDQANIKSPFHVGEKDIEATKDLDFAKIHKTRNGYVIHYHGGYSVLIDDKLTTTSDVANMLLEDIPANATKEERDSLELAKSATEMIFRLPMFVFSHPATTYTLAEVGVRYMLLLQQMGEVPTDETSNPEYDKFLVQINEIMENYATGIEKEGREWERRNGNGTKTAQESESESKGESKAEA